jgi:hypothetical protein
MHEFMERWAQAETTISDNDVSVMENIVDAKDRGPLLFWLTNERDQRFTAPPRPSLARSRATYTAHVLWIGSTLVHATDAHRAEFVSLVSEMHGLRDRTKLGELANRSLFVEARNSIVGPSDGPSKRPKPSLAFKHVAAAKLSAVQLAAAVRLKTQRHFVDGHISPAASRPVETQQVASHNGSRTASSGAGGGLRGVVTQAVGTIVSEDSLGCMEASNRVIPETDGQNGHSRRDGIGRNEANLEPEFLSKSCGPGVKGANVADDDELSALAASLREQLFFC